MFDRFQRMIFFPCSGNNCSELLKVQVRIRVRVAIGLEVRFMFSNLVLILLFGPE